MKAARIREYGGPEVVKVGEIDKPAAGRGQVLVEVHASSLNPFDSSVRRGQAQAAITSLPITLGGDLAGVVAALGDGVSGLAVGDKVWGQASVVAGNSGALAEFAATSAGQVGRMPANLDFYEAASLPLVSVSAWQALVVHLELKAGQKLFVHGGAGGIGSVAVQLAAHLGAHVTATASGDDAAFVRGLGADTVVDYMREDFARLADFDAVFDTVGGDDFAKLLRLCKRGGRAVSMIAQIDEPRARELGVTAIRQSTKVTTAALDAVAKLVEDGVIAAQVTQTFALEQVADAFTARESGHARGKIVIRVQ